VAASSSAVLADDTADTLLQRGLYFSDLYNWRAARPYFTKSQQLFEAAGDKRNALYARLGAIRAGAEPAPLPKLSYMLDQELAANPLLQSDKDLRMFCLIVKGDFDGESDTPAMRRDWTEVASLAHALGNTKWQYRAQGQLGFADFYDGDLPGAHLYWPALSEGRLTLAPAHVVEFLRQAERDARIPEAWSEQVKLKAARGVLKAMADFGLLVEVSRGRRELVHFRPADRAIVFLAYDLHFVGSTDAGVVNHQDWALFGLTRRDVASALDRLSGEGWWLAQIAGSVVRITWKHASLEEVADALAR